MASDRIFIRNLSRRTLRFGSPQTGTLVQLPAAAPTGSGAGAYVDANDPTVKRDLYRNLGSYVIEGGTGISSPRIVKVPITGVAGTGTSAIGTWTNPEGQAIIVTRVVEDVTTQSTGAANLTVAQTGSATGTVAAAQAVGAAGFFAPTTTPVKLATADGLGFTGSASTVGLVANVYIHYSVA